MVLTRRSFLDVCGKSAIAAASSPLWLDSSLLHAQHREKSAPFLAVFFLRGGADGLHLVPPTGDRLYASSRQHLALRETLPFATGFGLHPELAPLQDLVERDELAVVHACGSPEINRSHFEAQDHVEAGELGPLRLRSGWLARGLGGAGTTSPFALMALAAQLPMTLHGSGSFAIGEPDEFGLPTASPAARRALAADYAAQTDPALSRAGTRALDALDEVEKRLGKPPLGNHRSRAKGRRQRHKRGGQLAQKVDNLLRLEASGLPVRAVFLESNSWDTHQNQGTESGSMANSIRDLSTALANLANGLRGKREWTALVHTEFGRTVRPNGSRGSDHGHGSLALLAGSRVRGGLHGDWPGLAESKLTEGRDLAVTADYRSVAWEVLRAHLGEPPPPTTFPGFEPSSLSLFA